MAITRACIDRFRSSLARVSARDSQYDGSRSKGQESRSQRIRDRQHRFSTKSVGLSYLFNLSGGRGHATWVAMRKYTRRPKTQYFQTKKKRKTQKIFIIRQKDWCDIVRTLRCSAFAVARFIVFCLIFMPMIK